MDTVKMRRPEIRPLDSEPSGRVARDDRGNAVWQWSADAAPDIRLDHPGLSLQDELSIPATGARINRVGAVKGYNPYESGLVAKKKAPRTRRDLRELSKWIEHNKNRDADPES